MLDNLNSVDSDTEKGIQTVDEAIKLCEDAIKKNEIKRPTKQIYCLMSIIQ